MEENQNIMKRLLFILLIMPTILLAQNKPLLVEGTTPNLFISHTVAPKENYYSIGRLYNISPKEIAPYNNLVLEKGLSLNQIIKVPLMASNFTQTNDAVADEVLVPVYYLIKQKEGLYRVALNSNKLDVDVLKQWNNIKGESVANGTRLIIGYLKVKKELSALANNAKEVAPKIIKTEAVVKPVIKPVTKPDISNETLPVVKNNTKQKPIVKEVATVPNITAEAVPEEKSKTIEKPKVEPQNTTITNDGLTIKNYNGGLFKADYEKQITAAAIVNENGAAAVFKSTSGWDDGKYYCLHNTATAGSILKITSTVSGKSIYAKVLDVMPDIKQNTALILRLSNAAANELGATENKFDCTISYSK